jgi:hypothetical protein
MISERTLGVGEVKPLGDQCYLFGGKTGEYRIDWKVRRCACPATVAQCWHLRHLGVLLTELEAACPACRGVGWLDFQGVPFYSAPGKLAPPLACVACSGSGRRADVPDYLLAIFQTAKSP